MSSLLILCLILNMAPTIVLAAPVINITTQPNENTYFTRGEISGRLSVAASVTEDVELSYQWYETAFSWSTIGEPIDKATSADFTIPTDLISGTRYYFCEVWADGTEPVRSNFAKVIVTEPIPTITITAQPQASTEVTYGNIGGNLNVAATASNGATLNYQWYSNSINSNIGGTKTWGEGALSESLVIPTYLTVGTYYYFCEIKVGSTAVIRSDVSKVEVRPQLSEITIDEQPEEKATVMQGNIYKTLYVRASAKPYTKLSYQWYSNTENCKVGGTAISGATAYKFSIPSNLKGGTYYYYCVISGGNGESLSSNVSTIVVNVKDNQAAPSAPTMASKTADSVTLNYNNINLEFSKDGKVWQGPIFKGLQPFTTYKFYARLKETTTKYASPASIAVSVRTPKRYEDKESQKAPSAPILESKTGRSVTLKSITGAEYSKDGKVWQNDSTFYNLSRNTAYKFYARRKETDTHKPSPTSTALSVTTGSIGGFPFVPSNINMTNGSIKSGWAYIITHDMGFFKENSKGIVGPTREYTLYYIEHLGNDKYYIRAANGGYLSYLGKPRDVAQIIISDKPCVWKVYAANISGKIEYNFAADGDTNCLLATWCYCYETMDTQVTLKWYSRTWGFMKDKANFTIGSSVATGDIPKWWKDYKAGKTKPSYEVNETKVYNSKNSDKPTDSVGKVKTQTSVPAGLPNTSQREWNAIQLVNIERAKAGLTLLVTFDKMQIMSGVRSNELGIDFKDGHTRLDGSSFQTIFKQYGVPYSYSSENSALHTRGSDTETEAIDGWMFSDEHRWNLKQAKHRYIGMGHTLKSSMWHWNQLFANSAGSECVSIQYNKSLGYFTLKLKNGITAYAPYDPISSPTKNGIVTFNYPGVASTSTSTTKKQLAKPTSLILTESKATWKQVANNNGYTLKIMQGSKVVYTAKITKGKTSFTLSTKVNKVLKTGVKYHFTLVANGTGQYKNSATAASKSTIILPVKKKLSKPASLKLTKTKATWKQVANNSGYTLKIMQGSKTVYTAKIAKGKTSFTLSSKVKKLLKKGVSYHFTLVANGTGRYKNSSTAKSSKVKLK